MDESPHANELRRQDPFAPFAPEVEREYQVVHLRRVKRRVRAWFTASLLQMLPMMALDVREAGLFTLDSLVKVFICLPAALLIAWIAWSRHYERYFNSLAWYTVPIQFLAVGCFAAQKMAVHGRELDLALLTFLMAGVLFLSGVSWRVGIVSCGLMFLGFATGAVYLGLPAETLGASGMLLALSFFVSAFAARDMERWRRRSFLEHTLISQLVNRDGLTGLRNRRAFEEGLQQRWHQAQRDRKGLALLMIDVDNFKEYNDAHGHPAGDALLCAVGELLTSAAHRPLDMVVRYGGDEFAMILYDVDPGAARGIGERIRSGVEALPLHNPAIHAAPRVSVSIGGLSVRPKHAGSAEAGLRMADAALYEAKRAGRNRVVIDEGVESTGIHRLIRRKSVA